MSLCSESTACFLGMDFKYFFKPFVTIPVPKLLLLLLLLLP